MKMPKIISHAITALAIFFSSCSFGIVPDLDVTLNDFPPETKVGRYIQEIATNEISTTVVLSNGVLTVGDESIDIAQPSHTVVETNTIAEGGIEIVTNTYYSVYEDGLKDTLKGYAKIEKISSVVTNTIGEVTTNYTHVAYIEDIPPDEKKADKVIEVWDFIETGSGIVLTPKEDTRFPYSYWHWENKENSSVYINLFFSNGVWTVEKNDIASVSIDAPLTNSPIQIANLTFVATNKTSAMVVYTDALSRAFEGKFEQFVSKTNLIPISEQIIEDRLHTVDGIADTLRGIKQVVNEITGVPAMTFTFNAPSQNFKCFLTSATMLVSGDTVEIDWGDGSEPEIGIIPTNHTYTAYDKETVVIKVKGLITKISGISQKPFIYLGTNGIALSECLVSVSIDQSMPLESIGISAFVNCSGLTGDLSFLPSSTTNFGANSFVKCGITSLNGMPIGIKELPSSCFRESNVSSLEGMSSNITSIWSNCFAYTPLASLSGIPSSLEVLGSSVFYGCNNLENIFALSSTQLTSLPSHCFRSCSNLVSLVGIPAGVTSIRNHCFDSCTMLSSLEGLSSNVSFIQDSAFANCTSLQTADFSNTSITSLDSMILQNSCNLTSIKMPSISQITMDPNTLYGVGGSLPVVVTVTGETLGTISNHYGFAWGIRNSGYPSDSTVFVGMDGQIVSDGNGGWNVNLTSTDFLLTGISTNTLALGEIVPSSVSPRGLKKNTVRNVSARTQGQYSIDWGDGTINQAQSHEYSFSGETNITLRIFGELDSISGDSVHPFISIDGNSYNHNLKDVSFGNGVSIKSLGIGAFRNCTSLKAENIKGLGYSLTALGEDCFSGCSSITNIPWLSETLVTEVPNGCFRGTSIVSGKSDFNKIESLGTYSFYGCTNLQDVSFITNAGIAVIPEGCFRDCIELTTIPSMQGITRIGKDAFARCTKISDFNIPRTVSIGDNAFYGCGTSPSIVKKTDEDGFEFKLLLDCSNMSYLEVANQFGLRDGEGDQRIGIDPTITKFICDNGDLLFNNGEQIRRWEVVVPAIEFELAGVTNGTTFKVENTLPYESASLVWNWGDGHTAKWITQSPPNHTYTNDTARNYVIKVKGLLHSLSSPSSETGAYIHSSETSENPFLVGFKLDDNTPIQAIGSHSFSRCPNLRNINTLNLPRARGLPAGIFKKDLSTNRLERLSASVTKGVVEYGDGCFARSGIVDVSGLPSSMAYVPRQFFAYDVDLPTIRGLPDNILDIDDEAFRGSSALKTLDGWPRHVGYISNYCFADCTSLESILGTEDALTTRIGEGAFYGCTNLYSLSGMPSTVSKIDSGAFQKTSISNLNGLSSAISEIDSDTFSYCENMQTLKGIEDVGISSIGDRSFFYCTHLYDLTTLPSNILNIGSYSFAFCHSLTNGYILSHNVESIGIKAFSRVGDTAKYRQIDDYMAAKANIIAPNIFCDDLVEKLNGTLNNNENLVFTCFDGYVLFATTNNYYTNEFQFANNPTTTNEWKSIRKTIQFELNNVSLGVQYFLGEVISVSNRLVYVDWGDGKEKMQVYTSGISHKYTSRGPKTITLIGDVESIYCTEEEYPFVRDYSGSNNNLISISLGYGSRLSIIGDYCFKNCKSLQSIKGLANGILSEIGKESFSGCSSLESLEGIQGIMRLDSSCFEGCSALLDLDWFPKNTFIIPTNCFKDCTGLVSLSNINSRLGIMRKGCFRGCTSLESISFIPSCDYEEEVFAGCTSLRNLTGFNNDTQHLSQGMFMECTGITSLVGLPSAISNIPERCFMGCSSLTSISNTINNVVAIGDYAFSGCNLSSFAGLSQNVFSIGDYAFQSNENVMSFMPISEITNGVSIGYFAFDGCSKLGEGNNNEIAFPDRLTYIGGFSFRGCSLEGLTLWPTNITYIPTNCLDNTSFTNLFVASVTDVKDIKFGAFTNELTHSEWMESGLPTTRIITFPTIEISNILHAAEFPWGATPTTRFVGRDGFVACIDGLWQTIRNTIHANVVVGDTNYAAYVRGLKSHNNGTMVVFWGDGNSSLVPSEEMVTHYYSSPTNYALDIYGQCEVLGTKGTFLGFLQNPESNYVASIFADGDSGITSVGDRAFSGMNKILDYPSLPMGTVTNLGNYCFENCSSITNIEILTGLIDNFPEGLFSGCSNVIRIWSIANDNIRTIGDRVFDGCKSLEFLHLDELTSLTNIGYNAFDGCISLTNIILRPLNFYGDTFNANFRPILQRTDGDGIKTDDEGNKYVCEIEFKDTIAESIYKYGSGNPTIVDSLYYVNSTTNMWSSVFRENLPIEWNRLYPAKFIGIDGNVVWVDKGWKLNQSQTYVIVNAQRNLTLYIDPGSIEADGPFNIAWGDGIVTTNMPNNYTNVISHKYGFNTNTAIRFWGNITGIKGSFSSIYSDTNMPFIYNPNVSGNAQSYIKEIVIDDKSGICNIGNNAFYGMFAVTNVSLPSSITNIGDYAFSQIGGGNVVLPANNNLHLGNHVFDRCKGIRGIYFYQTKLPMMEDDTFSNMNPTQQDADSYIYFYAPEVVLDERTDISPLLKDEHKNHENNCFFWNAKVYPSNNNWVTNICTVDIEGNFGGNSRINLNLSEPTDDSQTFYIDWGDGGRGLICRTKRGDGYIGGTSIPPLMSAKYDGGEIQSLTVRYEQKPTHIQSELLWPSKTSVARIVVVQKQDEEGPKYYGTITNPDIPKLLSEGFKVYDPLGMRSNKRSTGSDISYIAGNYHTYNSSGRYKIRIRRGDSYNEGIAHISCEDNKPLFSGSAASGISKVIINDSSWLYNVGDYTFSGCNDFELIANHDFWLEGKYLFKGAAISPTNLAKMKQYFKRIIPEGCFYGCTNMVDLSWMTGTQITEIKDKAFMNSSLRSLSGIPSTVNTIGTESFRCSELTDISQMASTQVSYLPAFSFEGNTNLNNIVLGPSVTHANNSAFFKTKSRYVICENPMFYLMPKDIEGDPNDYYLKYTLSQNFYTWFCCDEYFNIGGYDGNIASSLKSFPNILLTLIPTTSETRVNISVSTYEGSPLMIDWGDGTKERKHISSSPTTIFHTYSNADIGTEKQVMITGFISDLHKVWGGNSQLNDCLSLKQIVIYDSTCLTNINTTCFSGCKNLLYFYNSLGQDDSICRRVAPIPGSRMKYTSEALTSIKSYPWGFRGGDTSSDKSSYYRAHLIGIDGKSLYDYYIKYSYIYEDYWNKYNSIKDFRNIGLYSVTIGYNRDSPFEIPDNMLPYFQAYGISDEFKGWSTVRDSETVQCGAGTIVNNLANTIGETITLWAVVVKQPIIKKYSITFDKGDSDASGFMPPQIVDYDIPTKINKNTFTRDQYYFAGWKIAGYNDIGMPEETYHADEATVINLTDPHYYNVPRLTNVIAYAQWEPVSKSVIFHENSPRGSKTDIFRGKSGDTINPPKYTAEGYTLKGFSSSSTATVPEIGTESFILSADTPQDLYGVWDAKMLSYSITKTTSHSWACTITIKPVTPISNDREMYVNDTIIQSGYHKVKGENYSQYKTDTTEALEYDYNKTSKELKIYFYPGAGYIDKFNLYNVNSQNINISTSVATYTAPPGFTLDLTDSGITRIDYISTNMKLIPPKTKISYLGVGCFKNYGQPVDIDLSECTFFANECFQNSTSWNPLRITAQNATVSPFALDLADGNTVVFAPTKNSSSFNGYLIHQKAFGELNAGAMNCFRVKQINIREKISNLMKISDYPNFPYFSFDANDWGAVNYNDLYRQYEYSPLLNVFTERIQLGGVNYWIREYDTVKIQDSDGVTYWPVLVKRLGVSGENNLDTNSIQISWNYDKVIHLCLWNRFKNNLLPVIKYVKIKNENISDGSATATLLWNNGETPPTIWNSYRVEGW